MQPKPCNAGPHPSDTSYFSAYCPIFDCLRSPTTYCLHLPSKNVQNKNIFDKSFVKFQFQSLLADYLFWR